MKKKRTQLTISLLVSNNIDTIKKCLESIQPILESIPSELIVVDTEGKEKSDGSLAVAEKYADLIVPFQWCNNFAAARNAGLKHAQGEWFLFLDDDEWFEDVSPIIDFFKTGEYKKYGMAYYNQRNYRDFQGNGYREAAVGRMVQLHKNTRFVRSIHERLEPNIGDVRYLDCFVHHYGYCGKSVEDLRKKGKRNIDILQMELKKDPKNLENCTYLAREYSADKSYEKAEEMCRHTVYELPDKSAEFTQQLNWIRFAFVNFLSLRKNYDEALEEGEKLLANFPFNDLTAGRLFVTLSEASEALEDWERTLKYVHGYIKKYDILDEHKTRDKMQEIFEVSIGEMKLNGNEMVRRGILSGLMLEQAEDVGKILQWFWSIDADKDVIVKAIEGYKKQNEEYDKVLSQCLSEINSQHIYILLNKVLASETKSQYEAQQAFDTYIARQENNSASMAAILKIVSKQQLDIEVLTSSINEQQWDEWLDCAYSELSRCELEAFRGKIEEAISHENQIKCNAFLRILEKYILINKAEQEKVLTWEDITIYCDEGLKNYRSIYNEILFQEGNEINLPEYAQFLLYIEKSLEFKKSEQMADCIKMLKEGLLKCPRMKDVASCLLKLIQDIFEEHRKAEFDNLKNKLIQEMSRFIDNGQRAEANMILRNLQKFLPDDESLLIYKEKISQI